MVTIMMTMAVTIRMTTAMMMMVMMVIVMVMMMMMLIIRMCHRRARAQYVKIVVARVAVLGSSHESSHYGAQFARHSLGVHNIILCACAFGEMHGRCNYVGWIGQRESLRMLLAI